jgi:hypothetical protein
MFAVKHAIRMTGLALIALLAVGCLVSGTFVIVEKFDITANNGFYFYRVDLTSQPDWEDHKDDIDRIDAVGFEFYITSTATSDVTFKVYIDTATTGTDLTSVPASASAIIDSLVVAAGTTSRHVTYVESLGMIRNIARLKTLAKIGKFDYFGTTSNPTSGVFTIDSGKVVVTFSASGS